MKKPFTEENIKAFWKPIAAKIKLANDNNDLTAYVNTLEDAKKQLNDEYDLPKGYSAEQISDILENDGLDKALEYLPFVASIPMTTESTKILSVVDESNAAKAWDKTPQALTNLKTLCTYIENLSEQKANDYINTLTRTGKDIKLDGGEICSPKKYKGNCPSELPKGITIIEVRVDPPKGSNAQYRVFGLLIGKTIHLLKAHTKSSGQKEADRFFDSFIEYANKYVKNIKFNESVSYNNMRGVKMKDNVFNELDEIYEIQRLENWARGNNDAWEDKLCEDAADEDYMRGYNNVVAYKKKVDEENQFKENCRIAHEFYLAHKEEIEAKRKEFREKRK